MGRIQSATNFGNATTLTVGATEGWSAPLAGNLLVAWANSDTTVTVNNAMTLRASVVDGNGVYMWSKVADGSESSYTFSLSGGAKGTCGVIEYDGSTATPFDVKNTSTIASTRGNTTTSVSVTSTGADGSILVAVAGLHDLASFMPSSPVWTNDFVNFEEVSTGAITTTDCVAFIADRIVGSAATYSTGCTWTGTNSAGDRQELLAAFDLAAAATPDTAADPVLYIGPTRSR